MLRINFWLGQGLPLSPEELEQEMPLQFGLNLMKLSWQEWFYLMRFLPGHLHRRATRRRGGAGGNTAGAPSRRGLVFDRGGSVYDHPGIARRLR